MYQDIQKELSDYWYFDKGNFDEILFSSFDRIEDLNACNSRKTIC